jgi:hypothetical protein
MASHSEKLANTLAALKELQDRGKIAIETKDLSRTNRERLLKSGFLLAVMKGWYIPTRPDESPGESTAWYASYWNFCSGYLGSRFDESWCLSPEQSLALHGGNWCIPSQLLVRTPRGGNKPTKLLHGTSIFDIRLKLPANEDVEVFEGLRVMNLESAIIACPPAYYTANPREVQIALSMISDPGKLLRKLLAGSHSKVAGRLAGSFRAIGREKTANTILDTMRAAGYTVQEQNPFDEALNVTFGVREVSPYVNRLRLTWEKFREDILLHFPKAPEEAINPEELLRKIDVIYTTDAYHSLSIEGYHVSAGLIDQARSGNWNPEGRGEDKEHVNALAARGYWQAFQAVKKTILETINGKDAATAAENDFQEWYRELFGPSVAAGIIEAEDLAGYRNRPVYIRRSMHTPPNSVAVLDLMPAYFEHLRNEKSPEVRVVLAHFIFVYIHPYVDGNGRMGRFLMNLMLSSSGYSWLVIPVERRDEYMESLEAASVHQDIVPFTKFLASLMK